jgi:hypothetical protein
LPLHRSRGFDQAFRETSNPVDPAQLSQSSLAALTFIADTVLVCATCDGRERQEIAMFLRKDFPGDPTAVRLRKMDQYSGSGDFSTPGPTGEATFRDLRVYGR